MRIVEGRAEDIEADRARTRELFEHTEETGEPAVRVWTPHRQVAFGRRDSQENGYEEAKRAAEDHDFPVVEREVGGRAVAYTGTTVTFARAEPVNEGITERYDRATDDLLTAFEELGVDARPGEPPDSFCPGSHSLQANGKIAGLAQRVTGEAALVAGIVLTRDAAEIVTALDPVYAALDVPFDPESVGSVERAGGESEPEAVVRAVETALVEGDDEAADDREA
ncbi:lipoate--protein ligase family protein [Halococcus salsus]|uniref:lipoate--protein ligase family protein n=1 Tax=Halococcus salsus TaxID=2162894 RepID=UPI00135741E1|nr:lipoate--protein ligase family protein [Halococcus salsus]